MSHSSIRCRPAKHRPLRESRQRAGLDLDLNAIPPVEIPDSEGHLGQGLAQNLSTPATQPQTQPPIMIDVEAIEDDVILTSPRAFAEARRKSQRNNARPTIIDVDSDEIIARLGSNGRNKRRRVPADQSAVSRDVHIIEITSSSTRKDAAKPKPKPKPSPAPPIPPPTFSCPICLGPLVEGTTTKCGHIFCKACIRRAVTAQAKCPTCRKAVAMKDLIRIFLPATT